MAMMVTVLVIIKALLVINFTLIKQAWRRKSMIHGTEQNHGQVKLRAIPAHQRRLLLVKNGQEFCQHFSF